RMDLHNRDVVGVRRRVAVEGVQSRLLRLDDVRTELREVLPELLPPAGLDLVSADEDERSGHGVLPGSCPDGFGTSSPQSGRRRVRRFGIVGRPWRPYWVFLPSATGWQDRWRKRA